MPSKTVKNMAASVRARLLNLSKKSGENYNAVLLRFFQERFLARLGFSDYKKHFVLKGGLLLLSRHISAFRPTVDIDMLGIDISNNPEQLSMIIKEIAVLELNDGVRFDADTITYRVIKEDAEYEGLRFTFCVRLGTIKSRMQLDIGFGDAVPMGFTQSIPSPMLNYFPVSELLIYPLESVIAEKFQAIVYLGLASSRMKDFFDILFLAENNVFELQKIKIALEATFVRRETSLENRYFIYEDSYIAEKERMWRTYIKKIGAEKTFDFSQVIKRIKAFMEPVINAEDMEKSLIWDSHNWKWKVSSNEHWG